MQGRTCCKGLDPPLVRDQRNSMLQTSCNLHCPRENAGFIIAGHGRLRGAPFVIKVTSSQLQTKQAQHGKHNRSANTESK